MIEFNRNMLTLYGIIGGMHDSDTLYERAEAALRGGVTLLQLREKDLSDDEYIARAERLCVLCHRFGVPLIVNDKADVALRSGADGVHVGIEDEPVQSIRRRAPKGFIIGATAKTVEQARSAERLGVDYIGVGAVFPSPTKQNAIRITPETLREICESTTVPAVAIGGIDGNNITALKFCGMRGIAVVSAIFGKSSNDDVRLAASELKAKALAVIGQ